MKYNTTAPRSLVGLVVRDHAGKKKTLPLESARQRRISEPTEALAELLGRFPNEIHDAREHFFLLGLNTRHCVEVGCVVSIGTINSSLVHPREVFRPLIAASCHAFIVAHNHPSGDPEPSLDDIAITRRLDSAAALMGLSFLDHMILTAGGKFSSLRQMQSDGQLPSRPFGVSQGW